MPKSLQLTYFAIIREERGLDHETVDSEASTAKELYEFLKIKHAFSMPMESLKVSVNDEVSSWETPLKDEDRVVFIPPVSGG